MNSEMSRWYAVYTQPRKEGIAAEHLARQGFAVYYPRYLKQRSHAGRVDQVPVPLFVRYVFVGFDALTSGWRAIRSTRGVIDLVRAGNDPAPLPSSIVSEMRAREGENGLIVLGKHLHLAPGDKFRVQSGPFATHVAIFEAKRDDARVRALLTLLGREVSVDLPIGAVAPLS